MGLIFNRKLMMMLIIQFNSILVYLGAKLNSLKVNYKVST
jgi:hypothetical protein